MKKILLIGSAFIGVIVGAGFASGQEILQYFTSFGLIGTLGAILSTALFAYIGMMLVWLGSREQTNSHITVIEKITGHSTIGKIIAFIIDAVLLFTLFGTGVVMLAGAGSNLNQQFGIPTIIGTLLMTLLVIICGMFNVDGVVKIIGNITPFLIVFIIGIAIYSFFNADGSLSTLNDISSSKETTLPNWIIAGINYSSFNTSLGASMSIVIGGSVKDPKTAAKGGLLGGLMLGGLILLSHFAIFSKIKEVGDLELPTLGIVNHISPILGIIMAIVIFGMIFNTALGMFYSFTARFKDVGSKSFKIIYIISIIVGLIVSFVGFTDLVAFFYPLIGYLGIVLIGALIYAPFKLKRQKS
ncbi:hypothetical protein [Staphylococcus massiliensis]|uniref:YkvI family membrane protein n=1 Tax=Staphylococcus massiliensis TaxID=555791 RepID=UPI001EE07CD4|nr:hypothetical protein [Staphylococcus massiliensis]MCG3399225.1 hypothetical protein [Staphylococcus massiliensis]